MTIVAKHAIFACMANRKSSDPQLSRGISLPVRYWDTLEMLAVPQKRSVNAVAGEMLAKYLDSLNLQNVPVIDREARKGKAPPANPDMLPQARKAARQ